MNGFIEREITMNAGIYHKSVCDVCLNCRYARCVNVNDGCAEYREALKQHARKYRKRVESEELRVEMMEA